MSAPKGHGGSVTDERMSLRDGGGGKSLWQRIVDVSLTDVSVLVKGLDEDSIEDLEQVLLEADFGVDATMDLVEELETASRRGKVKTEAGLRRLLAERIHRFLTGSLVSEISQR